MTAALKLLPQKVYEVCDDKDRVLTDGHSLKEIEDKFFRNYCLGVTDQDALNAWAYIQVWEDDECSRVPDKEAMNVIRNLHAACNLQRGA